MNLFNTKSIILSVITCSIIAFSSCGDDDSQDPVQVVVPKTDTTITDTSSYTATINLTQLVDGATLQMNTADYPYTNAMSQTYKVTRLQYLISDVTFMKADSSVVIDSGYHFIDVTNSASLMYELNTKIPAGDYTSISFTFGFDTEDNVAGKYIDLNTIAWNWQDALGGGYHFMRLEGNYINNTDTAQFKTHMGTAANNNNTPTTFEANHFDVTLENSAISVVTDFNFDIEMNIEEWYENPTTWDFTVWNAPIMPIYDAQKTLNANGANVFTFKK